MQPNLVLLPPGQLADHLGEATRQVPLRVIAGLNKPGTGNPELIQQSAKCRCSLQDAAVVHFRPLPFPRSLVRLPVHRDYCDQSVHCVSTALESCWVCTACVPVLVWFKSTICFRIRTYCSPTIAGANSFTLARFA